MSSADNDYKTLEYRRFTIYMVAGAIMSIILVFIFSRAITSITARMTYDATIEVKKTMLKENVENLISYLDVCADAYLKENPDVSDEELEAEMKEIAYDKIYSETHMDGTYMWVQKVLNYDGGDDYAIRLIHPNLSDTEGDYLSTNTVNPSGIKAYEEELEGVKANGSVYLQYDFKKLGSDEVTKKETYSSLYRRFDWIVCMGVNIDDLDHYQDQARENMKVSQAIILAAISATWLAMLYLLFHAYRSTSGRVFARQNKELSDQLDWDTVTGANSRIAGQKLLEESCLRVRSGEETDTVLLMLDIDYFKQFNDNYGHELGDKVLKSFVDAVKENVRENDAVIRWGGDEFIAVVHNIAPDVQPVLGDRILNSIRSISVPELNGERKITSSVGFTYIRDTDADIKDALQRADAAVYAAKEAGRDNWKIS